MPQRKRYNFIKRGQSDMSSTMRWLINNMDKHLIQCPYLGFPVASGTWTLIHRTAV